MWLFGKVSSGETWQNQDEWVQLFWGKIELPVERGELLPFELSRLDVRPEMDMRVFEFGGR